MPNTAQKRVRHYELKYEFGQLRLLGPDKTGLGYFLDVKNRQLIQFAYWDTHNSEVLKAFGNLVRIISMTSRREKFLQAYRMLEYYDVRSEVSWRAVRVAISHSITKVTEKPIVKYLLDNFGELDITLQSYSQTRLFYKLFGELVEAIYSKLLELLKMPKVVDPERTRLVFAIVERILKGQSEGMKSMAKGVELHVGLILYMRNGLSFSD